MTRRIISVLVCLLICLGAGASWLVLGAAPVVAGPLPTWYLAEGSTAWGFGTYINIENPNPIDVQIRLTYMTPGGALVQPVFTMAATSRLTINPFMAIGEQDFSTKVECVGGQTIAVDREMF